MRRTKKTPEYQATIRRSLHYFFEVNKKYKWYNLAILVLIPIITLIKSTIAPLIIANIVEVLSTSRAEDFINSGNLLQIPIVQKILPQGLLILALEIIGPIILGNLQMYLIWKMELLATNDLTSKCFDVINNQSMQFHSERFSGSLASQVSRFANAYERFMNSTIMNILPLIISLVSIFAVLFMRTPIFAGILLAILIFFTFISSRKMDKIAEYNKAWSKAISDREGQFADSVTNIMTVKSYSQEKYERKRYNEYQEKIFTTGRQATLSVVERNLVFHGFILSINILMLWFIIFGVPLFSLSISTILLIFQYTQTIQGKLWNISGIFRSFMRVFGDAHEMTVILDTVDTVVDEKGAKKLIVDKGAINFDHINFKHADAKEDIFNDFDLKIKPGERVGLAGLSGSGKTTLTKLLLRFADVDAGAIKIDDQNIRKVTQYSLRKNIAYVPQEASLFHRTIAENIAYAKPDATMEEIKHAAKLANAAEFIEKLPNGYETMVGERGIKLSGGQRQRIAIARAILKDAPILVLDEATSALDSESEALIQEALLRLMHGRTSIVVAHRLSTISSLDRIVVLDNGKIIEQGSHDELLKLKDGQYKKLWDLQSHR